MSVGVGVTSEEGREGGEDGGGRGGEGEDSRRRVEEVVASALPARPTQPRMQTMTDPPCDCMGTAQAISDPTVKGKKERKKDGKKKAPAAGMLAAKKVAELDRGYLGTRALWRSVC